MTKDEMKNRISMALKDDVLQQGFEIICKNLAELEKENAELKGIKDIATLIRANNDTVITLMQLNNMLVSKNKQLTKAKEILEDIIKFQPYIDRDAMFLTIGNDWKEVIFKAKQFLSEVEK